MQKYIHHIDYKNKSDDDDDDKNNRNNDINNNRNAKITSERYDNTS